MHRELTVFNWSSYVQQTDTTNILKGLTLLKWYTNSNSLLSILCTHTQCVSEDVLGFTAGQKNCWKSGLGCCWNDVGLVAITGWLPLGCWPQALELQAWASQSSQDKLKTMLVQNVMGQTRCGTMWKWKIMQRWDRSKHISIIHCISGIVELHSVTFPAFFWFTSVWKPGSLVN